MNTMKTTTQTSLFRKQSVDSCARSVRVECARSVRVECALYAVLRCERSWYAEGQGKDKGAHAQHAHVDMRVSRGIAYNQNSIAGACWLDRPGPARRQRDTRRDERARAQRGRRSAGTCEIFSNNGDGANLDNYMGSAFGCGGLETSLACTSAQPDSEQ